MVGRSSQTVDGYFRTNKSPIRNGDELFVGEAVATVGGAAHEHLFLIFAELDPNVVVIAPQPAWITFEFQDKTARHAPDYAVVLAGGVELSQKLDIKSATHDEIRQLTPTSATILRWSSLVDKETL
jgi:hypothetical protein